MIVKYPTGIFASESNPNIDPYDLLHENVPALSALTKDSFSNFTSLMVAAIRGVEATQEGRYLNDQYAEALGGEPAAAFMKVFGLGKSLDGMGATVLRHRLMDDEIEEMNPDIHQVVLIGAGMDCRSYRLQRFADCHVFELDSCQELAERKQRILKEMNAKLIPKAHDVIITDLAEKTWPEELKARTFDPTKPTLWIGEGLLSYLDEDSVNNLFTTIDSLSAPGSKVLVDMYGTGAMKMDITLVDGELHWCSWPLANTHKGGVLQALPWKKEYLIHRTIDGEYSGRRWDPVKFARYNIPKDKASIGLWYVASCTKPDPDQASATP